MIIGGPLALLTGAATTYDALEDISSLRASVIIAKAYGNTAAEQHAQAKLEDYLAQAPAVATGVVGDWLAKGTGKAGNLFKSLGINLSGDPEDWDNQQEELQKLRDDSKKKKPDTPAASKAKKAATPSSYDTTTKEQIQQRQSDRSERSSQITAGQKIAGQNLSGKSNQYKTEAVKQATKGTTKEERKGGAELDASMGISGLNKGGLMKKKRKK